MVPYHVSIGQMTGDQVTVTRPMGKIPFTSGNEVLRQPTSPYRHGSQRTLTLRKWSQKFLTTHPSVGKVGLKGGIDDPVPPTPMEGIFLTAPSLHFFILFIYLFI